MTREAKDELTRDESSGESKADATGVPESSRPKRKPNLGVRTDKRRVHAMRHGAQSKYPLEALARLGENTRRLRRMERALRAEVNPSGILGDIFFDRGWSAYLHCVLAARLENLILCPSKGAEDPPTQAPNLVEGELPVLIWKTHENAHGNFPPDLFQQLALAQRYDAHHSREMVRYFGLLSLLKNRGEVGLEECVEKMLGPKSNH